MKKLSNLNRLGLVGLITLNSSCYTLHSSAGIDSGSGVVAPVAINLATGLISHIIAEQRARKLEEKIEDIEESTRKQNETQIVTSGGINPLIKMHYDSNGEFVVFSAGTKYLGNDFDPKTREIYLMRVDRVGGLRQLTNDSMFDGYPRFVGKDRDKIMWVKSDGYNYPSLPVEWSELKKKADVWSLCHCNEQVYVRGEEIDYISEDGKRVFQGNNLNSGGVSITGAKNLEKEAQRVIRCLSTKEGREWVLNFRDQITNELRLNVDFNSGELIGINGNILSASLGGDYNWCEIINLGNAYRWTKWKMQQEPGDSLKNPKLTLYDTKTNQLSILTGMARDDSSNTINDIKRNGYKNYEQLVEDKFVLSSH